MALRQTLPPNPAAASAEAKSSRQLTGADLLELEARDAAIRNAAAQAIAPNPINVALQIVLTLKQAEEEQARLRAELQAAQQRPAQTIKLLNAKLVDISLLEKEKHDLEKKLKQVDESYNRLEKEKEALLKRLNSRELAMSRRKHIEESRDCQQEKNRELRAENLTLKSENAKLKTAIKNLKRKFDIKDMSAATASPAVASPAVASPAVAAPAVAAPAVAAPAVALSIAAQLEEGELPPTPTSNADTKEQQPARKKVKLNLTVNVDAPTTASTALTNKVSPALFTPLNIRSRSGRLTIKGVTSLTPTSPALSNK